MRLPEAQHAATAQDAGREVVAPGQQFFQWDFLPTLDALYQPKIGGGEQADVVGVLPVDAFEAARDDQPDAGEFFGGRAVFA